MHVIIITTYNVVIFIDATNMNLFDGISRHRLTPYNDLVPLTLESNVSFFGFCIYFFTCLFFFLLVL